MSKVSYTIERMAAPVSQTDIAALAGLLVEAVESGAAVSFLHPLSQHRAEEWWRTVINADQSSVILLAIRDGADIVGTVQLHPAWAPNQPHRAELVKLLVRRDHQQRGIGAALVRRAEADARAAGFTLLTLDAKRGGPAERLYRRLGWTMAGVIPRFALDTDGATPHDAVIFYKALNGLGPEGPGDDADPGTQ